MLHLLNATLDPARTPLDLRAREPVQAACFFSGRRAAFSLIELVIVIAILAVLAAVAVPRYADAQQRYRAATAARHVVTELTTAREHARQSSAQQVVEIDLAQQRLTRPDALTGGAPLIRRLQGMPMHARIAEVALDDGGSEIVFDGYGAASTGGTILVAAGNVQRTVVVEAATGHLRID